MNTVKLLLPALAIMLFSCKAEKKDFDAAGNFEADETIVSAQQSGVLLAFNVNEGQALAFGENVGQIDVEAQKLQKAQTEASMKALQQKTVSPDAQVQVAKKQLVAQQAQMQTLAKERQRLVNLVNADAAPRKQLDDIEAQITQLQRQMDVTLGQINLYNSNSATQNRSILSEQMPMEQMAKQIQVQINKGQIVNPVSGVVLTKYAMPGEMAAIGRPLYKIANLDTLTLKAFITGGQLSTVKLNQQVKVRIDDGKKAYKFYTGIINWISSKSEFTPKTIQTKSERENLVYAIKVKVKNDGYLKIGMYGEAIF